MKRKLSEILFFIQGGVIFSLTGFLIVINCMDYTMPYVWTCVIVVVLGLIVISLLCIYNIVYKKEQMAEQEQIQQQKFQMVYEENQACHAVIHDTRHFLYTVQNLLEHADIEEAKELLQDCSDVKLTRKCFCNRAVLNVILQYYQSVCDKAGISLLVDIREDVLSDLSDSDVTVLFGNLLENAYEAAGGQGFIELRVEVNVRSGMTMIEERNSYLADREKDGDGKIQTNKDKAGHGIGMKSIEKIVRNFDGVYLYDFDNETHIFWSKISLPYQKC